MIKEVTRDAIERFSIYRDRGTIERELRDFLASGYECAEYKRDDVAFDSAYIVAYRAALRLKLPIKVIRRGEKIFFIREAENA